MAKLDIRVGQVWRTRRLGSARVEVDRLPFAAIPQWRWALSNGHIVDDHGRGDRNIGHGSDLLELLEDAPPAAQACAADLCVWPDGTWCLREDLGEHGHMGDDYEVVPWDSPRAAALQGEGGP